MWSRCRCRAVSDCEFITTTRLPGAVARARRRAEPPAHARGRRLRGARRRRGVRQIWGDLGRSGEIWRDLGRCLAQLDQLTVRLLHVRLLDSWTGSTADRSSLSAISSALALGARPRPRFTAALHRRQLLAPPRPSLGYVSGDLSPPPAAAARPAPQQRPSALPPTPRAPDELSSPHY